MYVNIPTLRAGDLVIMDNLAAHKVAGVREAIEAVGAKVVYLPPYSPDFNPIELVFSTFKWPFRSGKTRIVDALHSLLERGFRTCVAWLATVATSGIVGVARPPDRQMSLHRA
jgi:transposase